MGHGKWDYLYDCICTVHSIARCTATCRVSTLTHMKGLTYTTQSLAGRSDFGTVLLVLPPTPTSLRPIRTNSGSVEKKPVNSAAQLLNFTKSDIQGRTQTWQKSNEIVSWSWYTYMSQRPIAYVQAIVSFYCEYVGTNLNVFLTVRPNKVRRMSSDCKIL